MQSVFSALNVMDILNTPWSAHVACGNVDSFFFNHEVQLQHIFKSSVMVVGHLTKIFLTIAAF